MTDTRLAYVFNEAPNPHPAIHIFRDDSEGGLAWDFYIVDHSGTYGYPIISVEVAHDAFHAFTDAAPLFAALARGGPNTLDGARATLDRLGFADDTQRTDSRT